MDEQSPTTPILDIIRKAGLTESQAKGYLALIEHGSLTPTELGDKTGESRTNAYMICEKLEKLGLATKNDGKKSTFVPTSPDNLKKLLFSQQRRLKQASEEITSIIPSLATQFHLKNDSAGIITLEGIDGIKTLYDDIIRQAHHLSIIASSHDRIDPEIDAMIDQQIKRQIEHGLESRALYKVSPDEIARLRAQDIHVQNVDFDAPAQIIIYGQTVAVSTFRHGMITSVINHPDIAETFQSVFDALWKKTTSNK